MLVRKVKMNYELSENQKKTIESYNNSAEDFKNKIGSLDNYKASYAYFTELLDEGMRVLDLACGPAQISKYVIDRKKCEITGVDLSEKMLEIAKNEIPSGNFIKHSIVDYKNKELCEACIIGFGIPYLTTEEAEICINNVSSNLVKNGYFYISFMGTKNGDIETVCKEKTSFGGDNIFEVHYHNKDVISKYMKDAGFEIVKEFNLPYSEPDGSITTDTVFIGKKTN